MCSCRYYETATDRVAGSAIVLVLHHSGHLAGVYGHKEVPEAPVANKIFAEEVELPDITICHLKESLRVASKYGLDFDDYTYGRMFPKENYNISMEDMFEEALNEHYYLLDITGIR